jgi:hypothetical protein
MTTRMKWAALVFVIGAVLVLWNLPPAPIP